MCEVCVVCDVVCVCLRVVVCVCLSQGSDRKGRHQGFLVKNSAGHRSGWKKKKKLAQAPVVLQKGRLKRKPVSSHSRPLTFSPRPRRATFLGASSLEWAIADGHAVATILHDLLKTFDHVPYRKLISHSFPLRQLWLLVLYQGGQGR